MTRTPKAGDFHAERITLAAEHFDPMTIIEGYLARYPAAYEFTLAYEGGYVDDPDDPGGCTNLGITIGTLTDWRKDPSTNCDDVRNLSPTEAALIYATNYWSPVWGNQLPVGINTQVWDFGVNAGPSRSIRTLQDCVASTPDGIMGPATLAAVEAADEADLMAAFHTKRQAYYESLSTFSKYGNGWTRRNDDCYALGVDLADGLADRPVPSLPGIPSLGGDQVELAALAARIERLEIWAAGFTRSP